MQIPVISGDKRFYVYEHIRQDTGAVFYVGKGHGDRANIANRHHRNSHWLRTVAKSGGFSVRFVATGMDEELAFLVECERINQARRVGVKLCNMTDGGDGLFGLVRTPQWRANIGAAHRGKVISQEARKKISESLKRSGYRPSEESRAKMSAAHMGHRRNVGRVQPDDEKKKRSASMMGNASRTGQKRSAEERAKASQALRGKQQPLAVCPHCQKVGGNAMKRWHFDNCKTGA